jgi:hypothetical protein
MGSRRIEQKKNQGRLGQGRSPARRQRNSAGKKRERFPAAGATTTHRIRTWWSLVTAFSLIYCEFPANYVIRTTSPLAFNKDRLFSRDGEYINSKWSASM